MNLSVRYQIRYLKSQYIPKCYVTSNPFKPLGLYGALEATFELVFPLANVDVSDDLTWVLFPLPTAAAAFLELK